MALVLANVYLLTKLPIHPPTMAHLPLRFAKLRLLLSQVRHFFRLLLPSVQMITHKGKPNSNEELETKHIIIIMSKHPQPMHLLSFMHFMVAIFRYRLLIQSLQRNEH